MTTKDDNNIAETLEQAEKMRKNNEDLEKRQENENKFREDFKKEVSPKMDKLFKRVSTNLISEAEKKSIVSKLEASYIVMKSSGRDFNLGKSLKIIISNFAFEKIWKVSDYNNFTEYDKKRKEIVDKIWQQISWKQEKQEHNEQKTEKSQKETKENEKKDEVSLSEDSIYFPILKSLRENFSIDKKELESITKKLVESKEEDDRKDVFLKFVNWFSDNELKKDILASFDNKEEITEKNFKKTDFFRDSSKIGLNLDNWISWLEISLAKNYIIMPDKDWKVDEQQDLSVCMDITLNSIISKNSPDFRQQNWELIDDIRAEKNLKSKYNLLKNLYKNDLLTDAKLWWKKWKQEISRQKEVLKEIAEDLAYRLEEAKRANNTEEINAIKKQINDVVAEWISIDIFEKELGSVEANIGSLWWWEKDKSPENKENEYFV